MKWKNMMKNSRARQHIFVVAERTHFGSFGVEVNLWCLLFMMSGEINNKFVIAGCRPLNVVCSCLPPQHHIQNKNSSSNVRSSGRLRRVFVTCEKCTTIKTITKKKISNKKCKHFFPCFRLYQLLQFSCCTRLRLLLLVFEVGLDTPGKRTQLATTQQMVFKSSFVARQWATMLLRNEIKQFLADFYFFVKIFCTSLFMTNRLFSACKWGGKTTLFGKLLGCGVALRCLL